MVSSKDPSVALAWLTCFILSIWFLEFIVEGSNLVAIQNKPCYPNFSHFAILAQLLQFVYRILPSHDRNIPIRLHLLYKLFI